jgi:hypothetical protein
VGLSIKGGNIAVERKQTSLCFDNIVGGIDGVTDREKLKRVKM